ncbi:hypothetical protein HNQ59_003981 [Chitinivorax tropicus]|uniref:Type III secretion system effector HopBF1-like domain-containing protein n=2 Tax=Chitinivorax tropicus TaxID=714531 RepID=A0A840MWF7_9PROT|nr:hypothetical protein [Chitinivorax tropicus]
MYTPRKGVFESAYSQAIEGVHNSDGIGNALINFGLATAVAPMTLLDMTISGAYNAINEASISGQRWARYGFSNDTADAWVGSLSFANGALGLSPATGLKGVVGPSVELVKDTVSAVRAPISHTAAYLRGKGLPDWNILPLEYTPGTLYSNPLPVRLERVVPGGVELGGGFPNTINRSDLGILLGSGGNKDVFAYGESQAIGLLRAGKNPQLLTDELRLLNQLEELGLPTVNARGPINVSGQSGLVFDRFAQGSKDIVKLENGKVRIVGESSLLNAQSVTDLLDIRNTMVNDKIQINDLQFLISERGRVVIADPLAVNVNTSPSKNNLRMIDLLIQSARRNGPF